MAIEVRIPKEITEYRPKIFLGLTGRQLLATALALVVGVPLYIVMQLFIGSNNASSIIIVLVMPIFAVGFVRIKGYSLEKYLLIVIKHRYTQQKRYYRTENALDRMPGESGKEMGSHELIRQKTFGRAGGECNITLRGEHSARRKTIAQAKREIRSVKKAQGTAKQKSA